MLLHFLSINRNRHKISSGLTSLILNIDSDKLIKSSLIIIMQSKSLQLCSTLCNPMDCSLPGSSVHGILQAGILEWVAMHFSRGSSQKNHRYTCIPHPEPPSLLSPCTIPLVRPSAPAPSIQYHALNLDWRFISYMMLYMFQCHFPRSSHPLPLPQSPKDCSIYLSILLSHIQGYPYHLSKFHIYVLVYCIGVFLSGLLHSV